MSGKFLGQIKPEHKKWLSLETASGAYGGAPNRIITEEEEAAMHEHLQSIKREVREAKRNDPGFWNGDAAWETKAMAVYESPEKHSA